MNHAYLINENNTECVRSFVTVCIMSHPRPVFNSQLLHRIHDTGRPPHLGQSINTLYKYETIFITGSLMSS